MTERGFVPRASTPRVGCCHRQPVRRSSAARAGGAGAAVDDGPAGGSPEGPAPDFLDLAYEPREAVLFIKRAADSGSLQAKAMINRLANVAPTKRDPLIQVYIDGLTKAGRKPGNEAR